MSLLLSPQLQTKFVLNLNNVLFEIAVLLNQVVSLLLFVPLGLARGLLKLLALIS
jgi:hypothetical protein